MVYSNIRRHRRSATVLTTLLAVPALSGTALAQGAQPAKRPVASAARASSLGKWAPAPRKITRQGGKGGVIGIHAALLPTGKVMWFSYPVEYSSTPNPQDTAWAVLWNPVTGRFKDVPPPKINPATGLPSKAKGVAKHANIWCGGQVLLSNGQLLVTGGTLSYPGGGMDLKGLNTNFTFNPFTEKWTRRASMRHGRWYPTDVRLPDGRVLIMEGWDETGTDTHNTDIEMYDPRAPRGHEISLVGTKPVLGGTYYPHAFVMPTGRIIVAGQAALDTWAWNLPSLSVTDIQDSQVNHYFSSEVLMPLNYNSAFGKLMEIGGAYTEGGPVSLATRVVEEYDEKSNTWSDGPFLNVPRGHTNTITLPDGTLVSIGGGVGLNENKQAKWTAVPKDKTIEILKPGAKKWVLGPRQKEYRAYHSTALLLPDGSIVSAGDDRNGGNNRDTFQIYKPWYFYAGSRPVIRSAPKRFGFNRTIKVRTPDRDIKRAVLIAPGTTTHATDMNQRMIRLPAKRTAGGYRVKTPKSGNIAPSGYYMLFLVDNRGRPSKKAAWVHVG